LIRLIAFLADAATSSANTSNPTGGAEPPGWAKALTSAGPLPILIVGMVLIMLFMGRSKKTQERKREDMLKQLKRGDRIQTIGGILGTVVRAEETQVEVKVDESNNTKMWFTRSAIHRVVDEEKAEAKP
jgi:preprotein translocase subunit YajC